MTADRRWGVRRLLGILSSGALGIGGLGAFPAWAQGASSPSPLQGVARFLGGFFVVAGVAVVVLFGALYWIDSRRRRKNLFR